VVAVAPGKSTVDPAPDIVVSLAQVSEPEMLSVPGPVIPAPEFIVNAERVVDPLAILRERLSSSSCAALTFAPSSFTVVVGPTNAVGPERLPAKVNDPPPPNLMPAPFAASHLPDELDDPPPAKLSLPLCAATVPLFSKGTLTSTVALPAVF